VLRQAGFQDRVEELLGLPAVVLQLATLVGVVLFFSHLAACALAGMAMCQGGRACWTAGACVGASAYFDDDPNDDPDDTCWPDLGRGLQYLATLYWAVTTITSVGYGDIVLAPDAIHEVRSNSLLLLLNSQCNTSKKEHERKQQHRFRC
jgi:hypothetical protein